MNQPDLWKQFDEKPPSSIPPVRTIMDKESFQDASSEAAALWKSLDPHISFFYEKGSMLSRGSSARRAEYEKVLQDIINCIFQIMRDNIQQQELTVEDKQVELQKVSAAELVFKSGIEVIKNLNLKLDINLIISIMYGYVSQCTTPIAKDYEDRQSTKH
tara:strand:- start:558 stop:1034 length:477 start_codon:yes stop_codon:yes gene_type:complete